MIGAGRGHGDRRSPPEEGANGAAFNDLRLSEFPAAEKTVYLNNAAIAPLPRRAARAMQAVAEEICQYGATRYDRVVEHCERLRVQGSRLLNAHSGEVAIIPSTSHGISLVAFGLPWSPGDNLVVGANEFPANVYPWWYQQRRHGVEVRTVRVPAGQPVSVVELEPLVDSNTRVVAISSVQFRNGERCDLAEIAALCHQRGALLFVDAIQSLGVDPIDVQAMGIDFLAADGHKWLLGPEGTGLFFCADRNLERLALSAAGWRSVVNPLAFEELDLKLHPSSRRFEPGSIDCAGAAALSTSVEMILEIGQEAIRERVQGLTEYLLAGLDRIGGVEVLTPRPREMRAGIVTFRATSSSHKSEAMDHRPGPGKLGERDASTSLYRFLEGMGFFVAPRSGGVRVSPHFYNNGSDMDRLLEAVAEWVDQERHDVRHCSCTDGLQEDR